MAMSFSEQAARDHEEWLEGQWLEMAKEEIERSIVEEQRGKGVFPF